MTVDAGILAQFIIGFAVAIVFGQCRRLSLALRRHQRLEARRRCASRADADVLADAVFGREDDGLGAYHEELASGGFAAAHADDDIRSNGTPAVLPFHHDGSSGR